MIKNFFFHLQNLFEKFEKYRINFESFLELEKLCKIDKNYFNDKL